MRLLIVIFAVVVLSFGRRKPKLRVDVEAIFGKPIDMRIVNDIVAQEANSLGIKVRRHILNCFYRDEIEQKKLIGEGFEELEQRFSGLRFSSNETVLEELKEMVPNAHAAFSYFFTDAIQDLGRDAHKFAAQLKKDLITMLYNHGTMSPEERPAMYGKALKKIFADYKKLRWETQDDFEQNTCFRTSLRISDATGANVGKVTKFKKVIEDLMSLA